MLQEALNNWVPQANQAMYDVIWSDDNDNYGFSASENAPDSERKGEKIVYILKQWHSSSKLL